MEILKTGRGVFRSAVLGGEAKKTVGVDRLLEVISRMARSSIVICVRVWELCDGSVASKSIVEMKRPRRIARTGKVSHARRNPKSNV